MDTKSLTDKQEVFCQEYLIDLNATQAAIRAGYSESTANRIGSENLSKPDIQARISALMTERQERAQVNADYVLNRLVEIDQMDAIDILNGDGSMKPINEWPKIWRQFISGIDITELSGSEDKSAIIKKIKWPDKVKNLELLGKHVQVGAFKDKVDIGGTFNHTVNTPLLALFNDD